MILNERQYKTTKGWVRKFEKTLENLLTDPAEQEGVHPLLYKARVHQAEGLLEDFRKEIADYEALRSGERCEVTVNTLSDLPLSLIIARIARRMTQKDLADRLGVKPQQIQHYEATRYANASITRLQEVAAHLGVNLQGVMHLCEPPAPK